MEGYFRIGTNYYKLVYQPQLDGNIFPVIVPWTRQAIIDDHKKDALESVKRYEGFTVIPSHSNYQYSVKNFYNLYAPLTHDLTIEYSPGSIPLTLSFLNHIFGDQLELGLDFITLLWQKPTQMLPILCLTSSERNTGKTTFLNWLKSIFQDNMTTNTNDDFRSRFNSDWALGKLIIAIDEVLLERREDSERLKNLSTAKNVKPEAKGKDKVEVRFFGHFILCSNNEDSFVLIDDKEIRYWVLKISPLQSVDSDFEDKLLKELPQFIAFLNQRKISCPKRTRMWFTPEQIHTSALDKLIKGTKVNLEKELIVTLDELLKEYDLQEIKFTTEDLQNLLRDSLYKTPRNKIIEIIKGKWGLKNINSSYFRYHHSIHPGTNEWQVSHENIKGRCYTFSREFIDSMLKC
ncbi:hypothetical protein SAMN06296241_3138 [Salinimicrobium sediminis]|uniref:NrS-1 polymerase-like helicase domain-containing protein n=1 Tax=Salinimicrobium sediminis TaxID=1343891 RepID=A0A285XAU7_9FLAO|nr:primase-helicase family protein [Salinimicrobium sediminis]SOC81559.1 hypothetical protein SAMN06296241_3138 [Salinimicrobium sediminis]